MPEISLNLLKEKIIKTDTVITLLADKNAKISQLREKLKLLYHKYVNKLKECEVLQLKIDLCKLEHEPLQLNLKMISEKYKVLQAEYEKLTNVSEIRYQNKCMEIELQMRKYDILTLQKEQCSSCQELSIKHDSMCKKYEKINKQFNKLTEKYKSEQEENRSTFNNFDQVKKDYSNMLQCLKENHTQQTTKFQNRIKSIELSKLKLEEEIIHLNNKIDVLTSQENVNCQKIHYSEEFDVHIKTSNNEQDEFENILNAISNEYIPALLSPLPKDSIFDPIIESEKEITEKHNNLNLDVISMDMVSLLNSPQSERTNIDETRSEDLENIEFMFENEDVTQNVIENISFQKKMDIETEKLILNKDSCNLNTLTSNNNKNKSESDYSLCKNDTKNTNFNGHSSFVSSNLTEELVDDCNLNQATSHDYENKSESDYSISKNDTKNTNVNGHNSFVSSNLIEELVDNCNLNEVTCNDNENKSESDYSICKNVTKNININGHNSFVSSNLTEEVNNCNLNEVTSNDNENKPESDYSICKNDTKNTNANGHNNFVSSNLAEELVDNCNLNEVTSNNENKFKSDNSMCKNDTKNTIANAHNNLVSSNLTEELVTTKVKDSFINEENASFLAKLVNQKNSKDGNLIEKNSFIPSLSHQQPENLYDNQLELQNNIVIPTSIFQEDTAIEICNPSEVISIPLITEIENRTHNRNFQLENDLSILLQELTENKGISSWDAGILTNKLSKCLDIASDSIANLNKENEEHPSLSSSNKLITDESLNIAHEEMIVSETNNSENINLGKESSVIEEKHLQSNVTVDEQSDVEVNFIENTNFEQNKDFPSLGKLTDNIHNCDPKINIVDFNPNNTCQSTPYLHQETNNKEANLKYTDQYYSNQIEETLGNIISYQQQSSKYLFRTVLGNNILGFIKQSDKDIQKTKRMILSRKQPQFHKIKMELFKSLVQYFSKKMNLNYLVNFPRKRAKCHSSKFKNMRKQQMLRWRRFRELYLSNTDTDSDNSRFIHIKRKAKNKNQSQSKIVDSKSEAQFSSISEDEETIQKIFNEEHNYQALISNHKALEEFYMSKDTEIINDMKSQTEKVNTELKSIGSFKKSSSNNLLGKDALELDIDKDINSDSGYVKSDIDDIKMNPIHIRKRISEEDSSEESFKKRKCILINDEYVYKICDVKQDNLEINIDNSGNTYVQDNLTTNIESCISRYKNPVFSKDLDSVGEENIESDSSNINSDITIETKNMTAEICSLLHQSESALDNCLTSDSNINRTENWKECDSSERNNLHYLFGSDCESICSNDDNNTSHTEVNNENRILSNAGKEDIDIITSNEYYLRSNTEHNKIKIKEKARKNNMVNQESNHSSEVNNSTASYQKSIDTTKVKKCITRLSKLKSKLINIRKMKSRSFDIDLNIDSKGRSKLEIISPENDPLHMRLKQETLSKGIRNKNNGNNTVRTSYKRPNSLKNQNRVLDLPVNPLDLIEVQDIKTGEKCNNIPEKSEHLTQEKANLLLNKLLTFPDKASISEEVTAAFSGQEHDYIFRTIINELCLDISKPDTKYTPPAPVLTETQRIILGFLIKLNRTTSSGLLELFMSKIEKFLLTLTADKLNVLGNVTRLYLAICKLQRKVHRMRRMVCDSFYFMGDLSVPFLFTVLSTWTEVMPLESELSDDPLVKVIVEIIKMKKCSSPGYNLISLNKLLKVYYGYNMEESYVEDVFAQIFKAYTETQCKKFEYAILILCKNLTKSWVSEKIKLHMRPVIEGEADARLKTNIIRLVNNITKDYDSAELSKLTTSNNAPDRQIMSNVL